MTTFRRLIQAQRIVHKDTIQKMARGLRISPSFAKHIIYSDIVPVSPRLINALAKRYGIPKEDLHSLAKRRNKIGKAYYKAYRSK